MNRTYKITKETLSDYMTANKMSNQSIVGESADSFIVKKGSQMTPLSKSVVESWCISSGKVEGLGLNQNDRTIYEASKRKNTVEINAEKAKANTYKDSNLDSYRKTTKEYRINQAVSKAQENLDDELTSKHYGSYQSKKR